MIYDSKRVQSLSKYSYQSIFNAFFNTSLNLNQPIAIWKLPHEEKWQLIVGDKVAAAEKPIERLDPGFLINNFKNKGIKDFLYLKSIIHLQQDIENVEELIEGLGTKFKEEFYKEILLWKENKQSSLSFSTAAADENDEAFQKNVERAIDEINKGVFQKVILSRRKKIEFSHKPGLIQIFEKLSAIYKNAFTSLIFIPGTGVWMGASPETLICIKNRMFKTCSLAGTQSLNANVTLKNVAWTQKEIEEQAFVSRYIINCFKKIRLREYIEEGPKTVQAGNLLHLRTDFTVNMEEVDFPLLGSDMLELLHPTSAVCGMPHEASLNFIHNNEGFERELYAGYLGPVNINNSTNLFVNLRCMKVEGEKGFLYAGAGITEDSDPEKEWLETEMKFKTLLNVLSS